MRIKWAGCLVVLILMSCGPAFATIYTSADHDKTRGDYSDKTMVKLTRGFSNALFGWTEMFATPAKWQDSYKHNIVGATFIGIPYGILRAIGRTAVGGYEMLTFYAPTRPIFEDINSDKYSKDYPNPSNV